jgi:hypothetical protein
VQCDHRGAGVRHAGRVDRLSYGPREILRGGRYGTLTPIGDAAAMATAIAEAMQRIPDRPALIERGLHYTAAAAADAFLEIIADLHPAAFTAQRLLAAE